MRNAIELSHTGAAARLPVGPRARGLDDEDAAGSRGGERGGLGDLRHLSPRNPVSTGLPDILAPGLKVIFCGINPGLTAAARRHHFLGRGNRFWRILHLAEFTPVELRPEEDKNILRYGCGLTTAVERSTARADQLVRSECSGVAVAVAGKIRRYRPRFFAFLGKSAFAAMSGVKSVVWGRQPNLVAGAEAWILPNPSGRNRGFGLEDLVVAYRELRGAIN